MWALANDYVSVVPVQFDLTNYKLKTKLEKTVAGMIFKKDNLKMGIILGIFGPAIGLIVIYFLKFSSVSFSEFFDLIINTNRLITSIGSLSLIANVVLFTIYINTHKDNTAKGIFLVTLVYGISLLILKVLN